VIFVYNKFCCGGLVEGNPRNNWPIAAPSDGYIIAETHRLRWLEDGFSSAYWVNSKSTHFSR
jgi:hypothetical protein